MRGRLDETAVRVNAGFPVNEHLRIEGGESFAAIVETILGFV
jgi:hypothetical protein